MIVARQCLTYLSVRITFFYSNTQSLHQLTVHTTCHAIVCGWADLLSWGGGAGHRKKSSKSSSGKSSSKKGSSSKKSSKEGSGGSSKSGSSKKSGTEPGYLHARLTGAT